MLVYILSDPPTSPANKVKFVDYREKRKPQSVSSFTNCITNLCTLVESRPLDGVRWGKKIFKLS